MTLPLTVRDLSVTDARGRVLLEVPHLDLAPATALGISGPSGAGKSTLLFALAGLAEAASGVVDWGGTDLLGMRPAQRTAFRATHIGMIFQDFLLFDELDALANASLSAMYLPPAARAGVRARAAAYLDRLGIADARRRVASFSGGERQRVAIARALANRAGILLADEPTASLHREAADRLIEDLIAQVRDDGKTLIAVSHDERLLGRMDRVVRVLDGGMPDLKAVA